MPQRHHKQTDFSGGEISTRMLMRAETEVYNKALLTMENFIPTLQGGAERAAGSRFLYDTQRSEVRVIPYLTPANERTFVELGAGSIKIKKQILDALSPAVAMGAQDIGRQNLVPIRKQIVENGDFLRSSDPWNLDPLEYVGGAGDTLGLRWTAYLNGSVEGIARVYKKDDKDYCRITTTAEVDYPTIAVTLDVWLEYLENFTDPAAAYDASIRVGKSPGASDVARIQVEGDAGTVITRVQNYELDNGAPWTGTLYIQVEWIAKADNDYGGFSTPKFRLRRLFLWADDELEIEEESIFGTVPYTLEDLPDVHFIQSPYNPPLSNPLAPGKQLVFTHPDYPPHQLFFNTNPDLTIPPEYPNPGDIPLGYVFVRIDFQGGTAPQWSANNYPNTCGSFHGRLVLAGAQNKPVLGSPTSPETETVWATKVGDWMTFSEPDEVNPNDSVEFNTIYRSPIEWVYGQKDLLIGAQEMEYVASAEGIFQPADLGVFMHSSHGSPHVQPAGFGESVLFAAEGGTKVREMNYRQDDQGWVAPDLTLLHPDLCASGIVRMVRMRNPHQMLVVLLRNGQIALLHQDTQAGIAGWSRLNITNGTRVLDLCVIAEEDGEDVLVMAVRRRVNGIYQCHIEAIANWTENNELEYLTSSVLFIGQTSSNVFSGLDHLEGEIVQVVADRNYLGSFTVTDGQIVLEDQIGQPIYAAGVLIGRAMPCILRTLPPDSEDPGSAKRLSDVSVRIRRSSIPMINGVRASERAPADRMDRTQELADFEDIKTTNLGWDQYQTVTIEENIPVRCEILGVYGKLNTHSL